MAFEKRLYLNKIDIKSIYHSISLRDSNNNQKVNKQHFRFIQQYFQWQNMYLEMMMRKYIMDKWLWHPYRLSVPSAIIIYNYANLHVFITINWINGIIIDLNDLNQLVYFIFLLL